MSTVAQQSMGQGPGLRAGPACGRSPPSGSWSRRSDPRSTSRPVAGGHGSPTPTSRSTTTARCSRPARAATTSGTSSSTHSIITIPSVILSIGIATLAAYAFSWMQFPGRDWLFVGVVAMLIVPLQMALIPMLQLLVNGDVFGVHILPLDRLDLTNGYLRGVVRPRLLRHAALHLHPQELHRRRSRRTSSRRPGSTAPAT